MHTYFSNILNISYILTVILFKFKASLKLSNFSETNRNCLGKIIISKCDCDFSLTS